ncbi:MAG TPA: hypothetical protein PLD88_12845, partial [Candidatus Berkiella sp.]|nr:hypothetical protein [Candidatus Berkiella sp.]
AIMTVGIQPSLWSLSYRIEPTSIPKVANGLDVLNHGVNAIHRLSQLMRQGPKETTVENKVKVLTRQYNNQRSREDASATSLITDSQRNKRRVYQY